MSNNLVFLKTRCIPDVSQVRESSQVRLQQEIEKVLNFPAQTSPVLTMITALGVGPLNSLGIVPNRWLYIFKSLWDGGERKLESPWSLLP